MRTPYNNNNVHLSCAHQHPATDSSPHPNKVCLFIPSNMIYIYIYMKIDDLLRKTCRIWREKESEYEDLLGIMQ